MNQPKQPGGAFRARFLMAVLSLTAIWGFQAVRAEGSDVVKAALVLRIELPGPRRTLSLAEIEVWDDRGQNIASTGKAAQNSQLGAYGPGLALDGDKNNFTHTAEGDGAPWWQLEWAVPVNIKSVVVYNRRSCCKERLVPLVARLYGPDRKAVAEWTSAEVKDAYEFRCENASAPAPTVGPLAAPNAKPGKLRVEAGRAMLAPLEDDAALSAWRFSTHANNRAALARVGGKDPGTSAMRVDYGRQEASQAGQNLILTRRIDPEMVSALGDYYLESLGFWYRMVEGQAGTRIHFRFECNDQNGQKTIAGASFTTLDKEWRRYEVSAGDLRSLLTQFPPDLYSMREATFILEGGIQILLSGVEAAVREKRPSLTPLANHLASPVGSLAPVLDGDLGDAFWAPIPPIALGLRGRDGQVSVPDAKPPKYATEVKLAWGEASLWIGARLQMPEGMAPRVTVRERDQNVYLDDCLEFFYSPSDDPRGAYYQIDVNAAGVLFDQRKITAAELNWNPAVRAKARAGKGAWSVEMEIPYAGLDAPRPAAKSAWKLNFKRITYGDSDKIVEHSAWATLKHSDSENYGRVVFLENALPAGFRPLDLRARASHEKDSLGILLEAGGPHGALSVAFDLQLPELPPQHLSGVLDAGSPSLLFRADKGRIQGRGDATLSALFTDKATGAYAGYYCARTAVSPSVEPMPASEIMLWPRPQKAEWKAGAARLEQRFTLHVAPSAKKFPAELFRQKMGEQWGLEAVDSDAATAAVSLAVEPGAQPRRDGYRLEVDPAGIRLAADSESGLYYGVRTLLQLIQASTPRGGRVQARAVSIQDGADLPLRGLMINLSGYVYAMNGKASLASLKDFIYRYVAGNRYNTLFIDFDGVVEYERHPEITAALAEKPVNPPFTKAEIRELAAFARQHYISDVIPALNTPGHARWLTKAYPAFCANPPVDATGKPLRTDVLNTRHPGVERIVIDCYDELMELLPSPYFHAHCDEVWWKDHLLKPEDRLFPGVPKRELFLEWIVKVNAYLKSKGRKMIIWNDMLIPGQFGGGRAPGARNRAAHPPRHHDHELVVPGSQPDQAIRRPRLPVHPRRDGLRAEPGRPFLRRLRAHLQSRRRAGPPRGEPPVVLRAHGGRPRVQSPHGRVRRGQFLEQGRRPDETFREGGQMGEPPRPGAPGAGPTQWVGRVRARRPHPRGQCVPRRRAGPGPLRARPGIRLFLVPRQARGHRGRPLRPRGKGLRGEDPRGSQAHRGGGAHQLLYGAAYGAHRQGGAAPVLRGQLQPHR
ncbi:MAG: family 20 glycosylhydrolase [Spirochaetes bacterium]|nr:family 20 glycosylhydrolase [Spirochaetota bacterium]